MCELCAVDPSFRAGVLRDMGRMVDVSQPQRVPSALNQGGVATGLGQKRCTACGRLNQGDARYCDCCRSDALVNAADYDDKDGSQSYPQTNPVLPSTVYDAAAGKYDGIRPEAQVGSSGRRPFPTRREWEASLSRSRTSPAQRAASMDQWDRAHPAASVQSRYGPGTDMALLLGEADRELEAARHAVAIARVKLNTAEQHCDAEGVDWRHPMSDPEPEDRGLVARVYAAERRWNARKAIEAGWAERLRLLEAAADAAYAPLPGRPPESPFLAGSLQEGEWERRRSEGDRSHEATREFAAPLRIVARRPPIRDGYEFGGDGL
jgi:hypothetical protein